MKINVPKYIKIEARQLAKAQAWFDARNAKIAASKALRQRVDDILEEDCCVSSTLTWHVQSGGICTVVKIEDCVTQETCDLTIDDDNNLAPL